MAPSIEELLRRGVLWSKKCSSSEKSVSLGLSALDSALKEGGLALGATHEFTLADSLYPPLHFLGAIIAQAVTANDTVVSWIGRACWPTPHLLAAIAANLSATRGINWDWQVRSLFIDPTSREKQLWAITQALQSQTVCVTVADGKGLNFALTRRLQLAAQRGGTLGLLALPPNEITRNSASRTKWRLTPLASDDESLSWRVELLRARGLTAPCLWEVAWTNGKTKLLTIEEEETTPSISAVIG
jgi:hypothetical protein